MPGSYAYSWLYDRAEFFLWAFWAWENWPNQDGAMPQSRTILRIMWQCFVKPSDHISFTHRASQPSAALQRRWRFLRTGLYPSLSIWGSYHPLKLPQTYPQVLSGCRTVALILCTQGALFFCCCWGLPSGSVVKTPPECRRQGSILIQEDPQSRTAGQCTTTTEPALCSQGPAMPQVWATTEAHSREPLLWEKPPPGKSMHHSWR